MKGGKFLKSFITIVLAVFLIYQLFAALYNPFTTISATYYETFKGIDTEAYIVRDETIISSEVEGVKSFTLKNGEKVSKNGDIAYIYPNEEISNVYSKIKDLQEELESLENIALFNDSGADVNTISKNIESKIIELNLASQNGKYENAEVLSTELFALISSKQSFLGNGSNVEVYINQLKAQISSLQASLPKNNNAIKAPKSGYFINEVDGFENILTSQSVLELTPAEFENLKPNEVKDNMVCKIVSDYTWYLAMQISVDEALKLKENNTYSLILDNNSGKEIKATLEKLNSSDNSKKTVAIFSFNNSNSTTATLRKVPVTIILESYKGIKLPNRSIRMVDDNLGVYVVQAGVIKFKKINVLYTSDSFTVCEIEKNGDANVLRLYDEVIDKGKNLYDGKTIN